VPVFGVFVEAVLAPRRTEERAALFDTVDDRVRQLQDGLREIDGCDAQRVSAAEAAELLASFWTGDAVAYDDADRAVTTRPVVGGERADD
jgi:hypothetical protein